MIFDEQCRQYFYQRIRMQKIDNKLLKVQPVIMHIHPENQEIYFIIVQIQNFHFIFVDYL